MNTGIDYIAAERKRQQEVEGWTPEHDRQHEEGELAIAAACYALEGTYCQALVDGEDAWPWDEKWDKRKKHDVIRRLEIAGALIAAEIDRLIDAATNP